MASKLYIDAENLILSGESRESAYLKLKQQQDNSIWSDEEFQQVVASVALPELRLKYKMLNFVLAFAVLCLGLTKILGLLPLGQQISMPGFLVISMIVPLINIYLAWSFLKFRSITYLIAAALTASSLVNFKVPEEGSSAIVMVTVLLAVATIALSVYLHGKLFPELTFFGKLKQKTS